MSDEPGVGTWRNRIVRSGDAPLSEIAANPANWRTHPQHQADALAGVLGSVGYVQQVVINARSGRLVDGHLRVELAERHGETSVPAVWVDLDDDEERLILATLDPLGALAGTDAAQLSALLATVAPSDDALAELLATLAQDAGLLAPVDTSLPGVDGASTDIEPLFGADEIIEAAVLHFRAAGFPYRNLPIHVCMQQINKLRATDPENLINSDMAYHVADTYHPHRFHASAYGTKSPLQAFSDDRLIRRSMGMALEHGSLGAGFWTELNIVSGTQSCSNFRPGFACYLYRRFCRPGMTVLDSSTGYGGRLVGFMASGVAGRYIGIDPNGPTHDGNIRMAADLGFADRVELHNLPAEDVPHEVVRGRCDFAFTSPPYFSKERYSDDDTQSWVRYRTGDEWRRGFLAPMLALQHAALKPGSHAVINIADVMIGTASYPLVEWTIGAAVDAGFEHVGTEQFGLTRRVGAGQSDEVSSEPVLVFRKSSAELAIPRGRMR